MARKQRIVHATDFSAASRTAFATAVDLARAGGAELIICHVLAPFATPVIGGHLAPEAYASVRALARRNASRRLAALVARARRAGAPARSALVEGLPSEGIGRVARAERAEVIVMGTHGHTWLGRLFLGSVAQRVLGTSTVPVLTVRPARRAPRKAAA
jgi:nucleotide-binding universal stress UspA family protein